MDGWKRPLHHPNTTPCGQPPGIISAREAVLNYDQDDCMNTMIISSSSHYCKTAISPLKTLNLIDEQIRILGEPGGEFFSGTTDKFRIKY
jgi:hypothetical protein